MMANNPLETVCVIGLGYIGLPTARPIRGGEYCLRRLLVVLPLRFTSFATRTYTTLPVK